jgi:hypothetical protein
MTPPAARETSTPSPTLKRYARWILLAVALIGTPLAMGLLQPLPSAPPPARSGGVLGVITVPRVGRVWVGLGDAQRDQTRAAEAIHSMDPHVRIFSDSSRLGQVWQVHRVHPSPSDTHEAELTWDGRAFRYRPTTNASNPPTVLVPEPVTGLRSVEFQSGFQLFDRGIELAWSARRPEWIPASPLDLKVQQDSERLEKESWTDYLDSVREMVGNRPGLELFKADPMSGSWPCELWTVVYHRSSKAISVLHGNDQYMGGAHGRRQVSHSNYIDGPAGVEWLDFAALFSRPRGWQDDVRRMILKDLRRQGASWVQPESPGKSDAEIQTPTLELTEAELAELKFTASSAGVFVHFEEYEAGSYAEGDYVVLLPWNNLEPWVRPEVVDAFKAAPALPGIPSRRPLE